MQIDWVKTIDDILGDQVNCPRCGVLTPQLVAGYSHAPWAAEYAPRCQTCPLQEICPTGKAMSQF